MSESTQALEPVLTRHGEGEARWWFDCLAEIKVVGRLREPRPRLSVPAQTRTLPPPPEKEPDWEQVAAVARANGCELLA